MRSRGRGTAKGASYAEQAAMRRIAERGLPWPTCKVKGCGAEAALGGACVDHGGAVPSPAGWIVTLAPPGTPEPEGDIEQALPQAGAWLAWVVSAGLCKQRRGQRSSAYPLRAGAVRVLLRAGRVAAISLSHQLEAQNRFFPGLELTRAELRAALALVRYTAPLSPEQLAALSPGVDALCEARERLRAAQGLPVHERVPLASLVGPWTECSPRVP